MKLIAQKPCSFGGKKFYIGDEIPAQLILNPHAQAKMGVVAIVNDEAATIPPAVVDEETDPPVDTITVVIHAEEGDLPLNLTAEGLQSVVDVLTSTAPDAEPIIQQMTDGDALILLHITDSRKAIKAAAEARAQALSPEEDEDEGEGEEGEGKDPAGDNDAEESAGDQ